MLAACTGKTLGIPSKQVDEHLRLAIHNIRPLSIKKLTLIYYRLILRLSQIASAIGRTQRSSTAVEPQAGPLRRRER